MREIRKWDLPRLLASLGVALVFALAVVACGSSDDGSEQSARPAEASDRKEAASRTDSSSRADADAPPAASEKAVQATYASLLRAIADGDGAAVCARMTRTTVAQFSTGSGMSCAEFFSQPNVPDVDMGAIAGAEVRGAKAVVLYDNAPPKPASRVPFVLVDGEWKLDAADFGLAP